MRIKIYSLASLLLGFLTLRSEERVCQEIDDATRARALKVAARRLHADKEPVLDRSEPVSGTCYRQLLVSIPGTPRRTILYLSPDRQFLLPALWDISIDPEALDRQLAKRLREDERMTEFPSRGPATAPVAVTVFSDFQCPYCAMFNQILEQYRREHPETLRIVFRNLPLSMHAWASAAARAGICISRQDPQAFWEFHDQLFAEQKNLSMQGLDSAIDRFLADRHGLNRTAYAGCAASNLPGERLDMDLSRAREHDIQSTPTVIINGRKYAGFRDSAAFATAIDEALRSNIFHNSNTVEGEAIR